MSQGVYIKLLAHVIQDNEQSTAAAARIRSGLNEIIRSVYGENTDDSAWQSFSRESENDYEETEAVFYEIIGGDLLYGRIDQILSVIDTLKNGSYGMMLVDTDYGVMEYKCYGNAEFAAISADDAAGYVWSTDDYFCLEKRFSPEQLADLLACDVDDICDEIEDNFDEAAAKLVPDIMNTVYSDDEMYESGEAEEDEDNVIVRFALSSHEHTTEQLSALFAAMQRGRLNEWTLRLEESADDGHGYKNVMICPEQNAVVIFTTSGGCCKDISYLSFLKKE